MVAILLGPITAAPKPVRKRKPSSEPKFQARAELSVPMTISIRPLSMIKRLPYVSDRGPARSAVKAQVKAVAAANCPVTATELWNSFARSTKSGPNITITVKVIKTAIARNTSNALEDILDLAISFFYAINHSITSLLVARKKHIDKNNSP